MENSCSPLELMTEQDTLSLEASDSNALILPTKTSKKRKWKKDQELQRIEEKQNPRLSKSQIRKLKKIQEEKEKALLLSKSIETLEKYKIPEDVYSLLQSSKTIGRAETMREKRMSAIQFSKVGLEVPRSVKSSKERDCDNSSSSEPEIELEELNSRKNASGKHIEPFTIIEKVAKHACDSFASQKLAFCDELSPSCYVDNLPTVDVSFKNGGAHLKEGMGTCIPKLPVDGRTSSMSMVPLSTPTVVHVSRPAEIENKRKDLPIVMMEQEIMEAINENSTVIICGETGCGKTTQVPQFLYEAGFGSNQSTGFGSTGGILVFVTGRREVEYLCRSLCKASEAMISKITKGGESTETTPYSQNKLVEDVNMKDINEAVEINGNSTHGKNFHNYDEDDLDASNDSDTDSELESFDEDRSTLDQKSMENGDNLADELGGDGSLASLKAAFEALSGKNCLDSNHEGQEAISINPENSLEPPSAPVEKIIEGNLGHSTGALRVLPLYAMLPAAAQLSVFEEVKDGERLVVATNVAETSLTIPGIKYVVDTGREKVKKYNPVNSIETYEVQCISKASAAQRAGRAGRTGPGHCYRLYSSAFFSNIFPDFSCAEISKIPLGGVVLFLKSMGFGKVANFPFPTSPGSTALLEAERCLRALEALDSSGRLTSLGKAMAHYPISPRHSRMLLTIIQIMRMVKNYVRANLVLGYAVAAAAVLSLTNPFVRQSEESHCQTNESKRGYGSNPLDSEKVLDKKENSEKKKAKRTGQDGTSQIL